MMKQKTGTALKVGDVVRHAYTPPGPFPDRPRELGPMTGVVTKVTVGGSGAHAGKRANAVRVRWASGSEGRHDAHMIVKTEESGSAPELEAVMLEVSRAFAALNKARARFNRCSKPESREAARAAMVAAEAEYRQVADRRDRLVELRNANRTVRP